MIKLKNYLVKRVFDNPFSTTPLEFGNYLAHNFLVENSVDCDPRLISEAVNRGVTQRGQIGKDRLELRLLNVKLETNFTISFEGGGKKQRDVFDFLALSRVSQLALLAIKTVLV